MVVFDIPHEATEVGGLCGWVWQTVLYVPGADSRKVKCGLSVRVRYVANNISVASEAGREEPLVCSCLYCYANMMKVHWVDEYEERVEGASECCR